MREAKEKAADDNPDDEHFITTVEASRRVSELRRPRGTISPLVFAQQLTGDYMLTWEDIQPTRPSLRAQEHVGKTKR